ncbi:p-nitrophenyl phosphatase [Coprinopsis marcescibilis]|uniref:4-nitrophenylphosphatase n=1 Tax=Coprinopsis marcescibilis TaxID=230819 RepID=A0A5C3L6G6_COPMA|nr:p-nitrophenyl phosphatase [Coprinopsis marcescibilis]
MSVALSAPADYEKLLENYDTWLFDCDGVLWRGDHLIEGAVDVLGLLRQRNKKVVFVTNNATKSRRSYKSKFDQLGVEAHVDEIYGSAYTAAVYVSSVIKLPKTKKVYVVGMAGLEEELQNEGISILGGSDPADNTLEPFSLADFVRDPDVGAVVCGLDTKINYTKLSKAFQYLLQDKNCHFIATNEDSTYPSSHGLLPGAGSISAPLRTALGRNPVCTGKPASTMLDCIKAKINFDPKRAIMVGDRLNTDILFGQAGGLTTLLVLTGITTIADITGPNASPIVPDFVTASLGDIRMAEKAV